MRFLVLVVSSILLVISGRAQAQRTFVVQGSHTAFVDAVGQAVHGDVLLVRAGSYSGFARTTQGIAILCDPGVQLWADGPIGSGLQVTDLPAGRVFRMRGGNIVGLLAPTLTMRANDGTVVFEDFAAATGVRIDSSRGVGFTRCALPPTTVDSSVATFTDCTMVGRPGDPTGGAALIAIDADVSIAGGQLRGGDPHFFLSASPALFVDRANVTVAAGSGTTLASGNGPVPAVVSTSGALDLDPAVTVTAGGPQAITGSVVVTRRPIPAVAARGVLAGQSFSATSYSEPGSYMLVLMDLPLAQPVPSSFGMVWVTPGLLVLDSGITPPSGARTVAVTVPPIARGVAVTLQPLTLLTSGRVTFGPPTLVVLN